MSISWQREFEVLVGFYKAANGPVLLAYGDYLRLHSETDTERSAYNQGCLSREVKLIYGVDPVALLYFSDLYAQLPESAARLTVLVLYYDKLPVLEKFELIRDLIFCLEQNEKYFVNYVTCQLCQVVEKAYSEFVQRANLRLQDYKGDMPVALLHIEKKIPSLAGSFSLSIGCTRYTGVTLSLERSVVFSVSSLPRPRAAGMKLCFEDVRKVLQVVSQKSDGSSSAKGPYHKPCMF